MVMVSAVFGRWRAFVMVVAALAFALGLVAPGFASVAAQDSEGFVTQARFVNADTDGGKYEIHINGDKVVDEFEYGDVSDWIDLDPGAVRLTLTADRIGFNYVVFDAVYPVAAGTSFNVVITDALVIGSAIDTRELAGDRGRVRLIQGSADTPAVDVSVSGSDEPIVTGLGYGRRSDNADVPAGTYDLDITVADTGESVLSVPGMEIEAGMVYDFVLMGSAGDDDHPLTLTPLVTEAHGSATPMASPAA